MLTPVLTFTVPSANQLRICWSAVEGAISYTIQFRTSETEPWETLETTDETGYIHYNVSLNTIYYYRVSANSETDLIWSNSTSAQLWYPTSCYVNKTATAMTVSWNALNGIDSWIVQRSTDIVCTVTTAITPNCTHSPTGLPFLIPLTILLQFLLAIPFFFLGKQ